MKLLFNARVNTFHPAQPAASAILIDRGEILAVGGDELLEARAEKINLGGRVILPGLTDAHIHLRQYSLSLQKIDCETTSLAECLRRVKERAQTASPGEWILGHGWNQNEWDDSGFPSAANLDAVAPHNPVYLTAKSLHAAWANTAALKLAGVTSSTPDPENGAIQRDEHGDATGILLETAMDFISEKIPQASLAMVMDAMRQAQPMLWKMGLTSLHDFDRRFCFMALQELHKRGELKLRVIKSIPVEDLEHAAEIGLRTGFGDDSLRIGMVKAFMDGALGPHTAAMFAPYVNDGDNRGILNMDGEQLFDFARRAADSGLGMAVHAIGDRANHEVLNAYEQLRGYEREHGLPALRHRIEHVQILHPDDLARLAQLNVIASMQPIHATSDMRAADAFWGAERVPYSYAWRTQLDHGATLAFGSDAPVESPNPFWGIHAAVTRRRPDGSPNPEGWVPAQKLTRREALEAYTLGPAFAAGQESKSGRLAPKHLADLIVLDDDPFTCDEEKFLSMQTAATMVGGEWVWSSL
ncbi:MAG: N-substituted formamide deformylase [Anaerolineales bacterium]|nr:N-substituted formamide deformylase [Anaerolineales bacterium]